MTQSRRHVQLITNDAALYATLDALLQAGNAQHAQHFVLSPAHVVNAESPDFVLPDFVLVDYRGVVDAQTLRPRIQSLPQCPVIILGDDVTNLEDPVRMAAWQHAGATDYLLVQELSSHWLRHALLRAHVAARPTAHATSATPLWQMLDRLFVDMPVIVCAFSGPEHIYRYANPLYFEVVGNRDIIGKPIRQALPELEGQNIYELLDQVYTTGVAYRGQEQQVWLRNDPAGPLQEFHFAFVYSPTALPAIVADGALDRIIFVVALDVSELVRLRRQWQEAHAQLNALFASSPLGLAFVDRELRFLRINPALAAMNGFPADAHIGTRPDTLLPDLQGIETILAQWQQIIDTSEPMVGIEVTGRTPALPDQDQTWEEAWFPITLDDEVLGLGIVAENITQRKTAEKEREQLLATLAQERRRLDELNQTLERRVQERSQQVRSLATELTLAEQRERHRIAQILHDHIQQLLYGIDFRIALLTDSASSDQRALLQEFKEIVQEAIRATRTLAVDLSPPVLQGEGLVKALHWLIHQMEEIHSLRVALEVEEPLEVTQIEMRVLLLQSVRELLFNVVKHASTTEARVVVRQETHEDMPLLVVQIVDHGRGFDMDRQSMEPHSAETFGLYSIRERLHLFGGYLHVNSAPGDGTRVTLVLPVAQNGAG